MIVYGDHDRALDAAALVERIAGLLRRDGAGIERHGALASALIDGGLLLQGVADRELAERGVDGPSPTQDAAAALLAALARAVWASWTGRHVDAAADAATPLAQVAATAPRAALRCRVPEGFAHYAVYPETYAAAAAGRRFAVMGIRSIGTTLGAMVAAGGRGVAPVTVRPTGPPFERRIALDDAGTTALLGPGLPVAIVDEGPGLSGSSFGGAADFLEARGVPPGRLHFFPSHPGEPGREAQPRHLARWRSAARHVAGFETLLLDGATHRLDRWFADLVGPASGPLEDIGGGGWRRHRHDAWPPVQGWQERRKYLLRTDAGTFLLKFVGLGRFGEKAADRARTLGAAGFATPPIGYRHGFLIEPWHASVRAPVLEGEERSRLVARIGDYLAFRARAFPADDGDGADVAALAAMARTNIAESLGAVMAARLGRLVPPSPGRRIETDNRMQLWEWLVLADGRLLKADGIDHHAGHDLVGCQDVAWDVAGAAAELGLTGAEVAPLADRLGVDRAALGFYAACYLAFQVGAAAMAEAGEGDAEEAARWRARAAGLRGRLTAVLGGGA